MRITTLVFSLIAAVPCFAQQDPSIDCIRALPADARFAPIKAKFALGPTSDTTFAMLADESLASDEEREAISVWATARNECIKPGEEFRRRTYLPQVNALLLEAEGALLLLAVDLYNRKVTYAKFNKRRQAAVAELRNKIDAIAQQLSSEQQAQQHANQRAQNAIDAQRAQEAEAARRQILMQMIQNNRPIQLQPLPAPRPSMNTDCYVIGNQMHCTSR